MNVSVQCARRRADVPGGRARAGRARAGRARAGRARADRGPAGLIRPVVLAVLLGVVLSLAPGQAPDPAQAAGTGSRAGTSLPRWSWPVPLPHDVVRGFEAPAEVWSPGHRGIDIRVESGGIVLAPDSGVVHFAGPVVDRPVVSIDQGDGILSSFEPVTPTVAAGETVKRGQPIGIVEPGHCVDGSCIHLGARIDGRYVSPLLLLGGVAPAVLLPVRR